MELAGLQPVRPGIVERVQLLQRRWAESGEAERLVHRGGARLAVLRGEPPRASLVTAAEARETIRDSSYPQDKIDKTGQNPVASGFVTPETALSTSAPDVLTDSVLPQFELFPPPAGVPASAAASISNQPWSRYRDQGHAAELFVAAELTAAGWELFLPREGARADFVASKGGTTLRVQVKARCAPLGSQRVGRSGLRGREYVSWGSSSAPLCGYEEIDVFAFCLWERRIAIMTPRARVTGRVYRLPRAAVLALGAGVHWTGSVC